MVASTSSLPRNTTTAVLHALISMLSCLVLMAGCQSPGKVAKLEQQLRQQETQIRGLEQQLAESQQSLRDQDQQLAAHRQTLGTSAGSPFSMASQSTGGDSAATIPEEVAADWGSVAGVRIQKLVSGIRRTSDGPVLHVVVQPVDRQGELRKVAGQLSLQVHQAVGNEIRLLTEQSWSITDSRDLWTNGFVSSGFHLQLPVKDLPTSVEETTLKVSVTLHLGQDRTFECSENIVVEAISPAW